MEQKVITLEEARHCEIKTNIGTMPLIDYLEIKASQNGFDSLDEMLDGGYQLPDYKVKR